MGTASEEKDVNHPILAAGSPEWSFMTKTHIPGDASGRPYLFTSIGSVINQVEDASGRPYLFTSIGSVINQVERVYNGLGQLVTEYQSHDSTVNELSTKVQYAYTEMADGANHSRLT